MNLDNCNKNPIIPIRCCYGPTGPTGPTGASISNDSVMTNNDSNMAIVTNGLLALGTEVNTNGDSLTYNGSNTVTINTAGTYLIQFATVATNENATDIGVAIAINGVANDAGSVSFVGSQDELYPLFVQYNVTATSGDNITIINPTGTTVNYTNSNLSIIRLD